MHSPADLKVRGSISHSGEFFFRTDLHRGQPSLKKILVAVFYTSNTVTARECEDSNTSHTAMTETVWLVICVCVCVKTRVISRIPLHGIQKLRNIDLSIDLAHYVIEHSFINRLDASCDKTTKYSPQDSP